MLSVPSGASPLASPSLHHRKRSVVGVFKGYMLTALSLSLSCSCRLIQQPAPPSAKASTRSDHTGRERFATTAAAGAPIGAGTRGGRHGAAGSNAFAAGAPVRAGTGGGRHTAAGPTALFRHGRVHRNGRRGLVVGGDLGQGGGKRQTETTHGTPPISIGNAETGTETSRSVSERRSSDWPIVIGAPSKQKKSYTPPLVMPPLLPARNVSVLCLSRQRCVVNARTKHGQGKDQAHPLRRPVRNTKETLQTNKRVTRME